MEKVFASPSRYVQGAGVLETSLHYIKALGNHALLLSDDIVYNIVGETLIANLEKIGVTVPISLLMVKLLSMRLTVLVTSA